MVLEDNCVIVGRALHPSFYHFTKLTIAKFQSLLVQKLEIKFAFVPSLRKRCSIEGGRGKLLSKENANLKSSQNMTRELYEKQALIMALFLAQIDRLLLLLSIAHSWTLEIHLTLLGPGRGGIYAVTFPRREAVFPLNTQLVIARNIKASSSEQYSSFYFTSFQTKSRVACDSHLKQVYLSE